MTLTLQVDAEQLFYNFLAADVDVAALVSGRVYSIMPRDGKPNLPFVRQNRVGGAPVYSYPLALDQATIQVDCWGRNKKEAWTVAQTIMAACSARLIGAQTLGTVCNIVFQSLLYLPDAEYADPPQPRYIIDVIITTKP